MCHSPGVDIRSSAGGVAQEGWGAHSIRSLGGDGPRGTAVRWAGTAVRWTATAVHWAATAVHWAAMAARRPGPPAGGSWHGSRRPACPRRRRTGRYRSPLIRRDHGGRTGPGPGNSARCGRKRPAPRRWERPAHPAPRRPAQGRQGRPARRRRASSPASAGSIRLAVLLGARRRVAGSIRLAVLLGARRRVAGSIRLVVLLGARRWLSVCVKARCAGAGRVRGRVVVSARSHRVRQWLRRKRRNVGFRGGRDEFRERPAAVGRRIFREGVIRVFRGVFRLPWTGIRPRPRHLFWWPRKVIGSHVSPAAAAKLFPR